MRPVIHSNSHSAMSRAERLVICPAYFETNQVSVFDFLNAKIDSLPLWPDLIQKISRARFARCELSSLPPGLTSYCNIASLDLSENDFGSVTAEEFYELRLLRQLDLSQNHITSINAILPLSITYLDLSFNTGLDVNCVWQVNAPKLEVLKVGHCGFKKLPEKEPTWHRTVRHICLDGNDLDSIPEYFGAFEAMEELSLFGNRFSNVDFPAFARPLRILNMSMNPLSSIDNVCKVQTFAAGWSVLKEVPTKLLELEGLRAIVLQRSKNIRAVDFAIPESVAVIDLSFCNIERVSERFVESCGRLSVLNLAHNRLTEIPDVFPQNLCLSQVTLSYNQLSTLPAGLMTSRTMEKLFVKKNRLVALPEFQFPQLREFDVSFNQLEAIPNCFTNCSYLVMVNISFNKLTDLPLTLSSARRLLDFHASNNLFTKIPKCILSFACVKTVCLSSNRLTSLPDTFGSFFFMKTLDLSNNHFQTMPVALSTCMGLRNLSLSHNLISSVPPDFKFPSNLCCLDLSFNRLTEFCPAGPLASLISLSLDCNQITNVAIKEAANMIYMSLASNRITKSLKEMCAEFGVSKKLKRVEFFENDAPESELDIDGCYLLTNRIVRATGPWGVGYASSIGARSYMEDFPVIYSTPNSSCFAVFDGHAGAISANIASDMAREYAQNLASQESIDIPALFSNINTQLEELKAIDGCAGVCAFIKGATCHVAGVGDSRIVRVMRDTEERMTTDHKPTNVDEFERLKACGIGVSSEGRVQRKLAMSRAFGDFWCAKKLFVEPDVRTFEITDDDLGLIIACDGLWDVIDDDYAASIFRSSPTAQDAATRLKNLALSLASQDNISVICVTFHPGEGESGICTKNMIEEIPIVIPDPDDEPIVIARISGGRHRR